jgi:hypothetical protein
MIFFKKDAVHGVDLESAINNAVFPGLQVNLDCTLISSFLTILIEKVHESYVSMEADTFIFVVCDFNDDKLSREVHIITQLED